MTIRNAVRTLLAAAAASLALLGPARAADEIKIGEINSYSGLPAFTQPYKKGWELALGRDQRQGRRRWQDACRHLEGRRRQAGRRGDGRQRARLRRRSCDADGHLLLQRRSRGVRLRRAEEGSFSRRRAADGRDHLVEGQPLHVPVAPLQLLCRRGCWPKKPRSSPPSAGRPSRRTTNMANPPSPPSRSS